MWLVWFLLGLWIAAIVIPPIVGMTGKVSFKWVVLWEAIMFSPIVLIFVLTAGRKMNMSRIKELYIPKGLRG